MKFFVPFISTIKIVWNNKMLLWWQIFPSISTIFTFPLFFIYLPIIKEIFEGSELQTPIAPWITISSNLIFFLFLLSYVVMNLIVQIATINCVVSVNKGEPKTSFKENFLKSFFCLWHILGLYIIGVGLIFLINSPFVLIVGIMYQNTQLISENFIVFGGLLITPIIIISLIIMELAQSAIIIDNIIVFIAFFALAPLIIVVITFWFRMFLSIFHCSWAIAYLDMKQSLEVNLMEQNEL